MIDALCINLCNYRLHVDSTSLSKQQSQQKDNSGGILVIKNHLQQAAISARGFLVYQQQLLTEDDDIGQLVQKLDYFMAVNILAHE